MRNLTCHTKPVLLFLALFICLGSGLTANAQAQDAYTSFMALETAEERFDYFFETEQKYTGVSAYHWKENIETIIRRINNAEDPLSRPFYETMLCRIYEDIGSYEKGAYLADKLLSDEANLDLKVKRRLLKIADRIYAEMQLFQNQLEVRKAQERLGEDVELYTVYENLGLYRQALIDYEIRNPKKEALKAGTIELARYYKEKADFKRLDGRLTLTAVKEYEEALSLIEEYINTQQLNSQEAFREALFLRGQILGGIGRCMLVQRKYLEAIPYLEQGVDSGKEYEKGQYRYHAVGYWTDLAECYLKVDRPEMSEAYLDSVASAGPIAPSAKIRYYHLRADHYLEKEDVKNAANFLRKYSSGRDSLERSVMGKQLLGQFVAFDIDQQTKRVLEKQRLDLERNKSEIIEREKIIYLSIVALLFSLLCVVALIVAYMKSVKNKKLIESQKQIIEYALVEKDSLLKEIHHRVKNNLQMVSSLMSLQSKNTKSTAAINALKEGQSRVRAMALIHQKLYQNDDLSVILMQEYIESLVASIQSVFKKEGYEIAIHIDAKNTELDVDRAIPIGLILNELVSNSYKYAFGDNKQGNIHICLNRDGDHYKFQYRDDGRGLSKDFEQTSKGSMGLRLIRRLANQLRSELAIDTQAKGAHFWFNFG